jgi:hypothetical protein
MFLIYWQGYWQELIETLAWAHEPPKAFPRLKLSTHPKFPYEHNLKTQVFDCNTLCLDNIIIIIIIISIS